MGLKIFTIDFAELSNYKFIRNDVRFFVGQKVRFLNKGIRLGKIFETGRGRVINQEYVKENEGEYPIYSSQTSDEGIFGYIDTYDFEGEYLTWTTDGYAGRVFYRNGKFNCTNVCGTAKLKKEFQNKINLKFLSFFLNLYTPFYVSIASGNPKLMNNVFEEIKIPLIPKSQQDQIVAQIEPIEKKIKELKSTIRHPQEIINEVFAREFGFDLEKFEEAKKQKFFEVDFSIISKTNDLKFNVSTSLNNKVNFQIPNVKYLTIKSIAKDIFAGGDMPKDFSDEKDEEYKYPIYSNGKENLGFVAYCKKPRVQEKATTISARGTIGFAVARNESYFPIVRLISIIPDDELILNEYLANVINFLNIEKSGNTIAQLTTPMVEKIKIPVPDKKIQQKIVDEIKAELDKQEEIKKQIEEERNKIDEIIEKAIK
jgi:restriction endonuclease S subunit